MTLGGAGSLARVVGMQFGSYLGRQIALGACRDDEDDDFPRPTFRSGLQASALPSAVDLRPWTSRVEDQGALGSCTSNALAGAMEYLTRRIRGEHDDISRLFIYYNQRLWDGAVREDRGASIASGIRVLTRLGAPTEATWPYRQELFAVQPPDPVFSEAAARKALSSFVVPVDELAFRSCLASGFPIIIGTRVTESFMRTGRDGATGMPSGADDRKHGRHALLVVGYDDARRVFVVRNSWGDDWGAAGHCFMPYAYVLNRAWTQPGWTIRFASGFDLDPDEHVVPQLGAVPSAPPSGGSGAGGSGVAQAAGIGTELAVRMLGGGGLIGSLVGGLAGGLAAGVAPGIGRAMRGRDPGALSGPDLSERILHVMRGDGAPPAHQLRLPWDDGLDEQAAGLAAPSAGSEASAAALLASAAAAGVELSSAARRAGKASAKPTGATPAPSGAIEAPPVTASTGAAKSSTGTKQTSTPTRAPTAQDMGRTLELMDALPPIIAEHWRRDGGRMGPLGAPIAEPTPMSEGAWTGHAVQFERGVMLAWDPPPNVPAAPPIALRRGDDLLETWIRVGAFRSPLGWLVAPVEAANHGRGRVLRGARGTIFSHPEHGTHPVFGPLFDLFRTHGELASVGYPIEDPQLPEDPNADQTQRFEHALLAWSPTGGARRLPRAD